MKSFVFLLRSTRCPANFSFPFSQLRRYQMPGCFHVNK